MSENTNTMTGKMSFGRAAFCILCLIIVLCLGFAVFGLETKVVFLIASVVVTICLVAFGFKLDTVLLWYADGCRGSIDVIMILMSVGAVIGTWMASRGCSDHHVLWNQFPDTDILYVDRIHPLLYRFLLCRQLLFHISHVRRCVYGHWYRSWDELGAGWRHGSFRRNVR